MHAHESKTQNIVTLHPKTVEQAEKHVAEKPPRKRRKKAAAEPPKPSTRVSKVTVDPRVWKHAMGLARGDRERLVVESHESVLVKNHPKRRKP